MRLLSRFRSRSNEIAESATDLSGVVSDVSRDSEQVKSQIDSTVGIARKGRSDMELVGTAMDEIRDSMSLLVDAIRKVGEASKRDYRNYKLDRKYFRRNLTVVVKCFY